MCRTGTSNNAVPSIDSNIYYGSIMKHKKKMQQTSTNIKRISSKFTMTELFLTNAVKIIPGILPDIIYPADCRQIAAVDSQYSIGIERKENINRN